MAARAERQVRGRPAAPGFAAGAVVRLIRAEANRRVAGTPDQEGRALQTAIADALAGIAEMTEIVAGEAAEMLAFQSALLEDEALSESAFSAIAKGVPADVAWAQAMDVEIDGYTKAEDEYFRARASDLTDVRDRVLRALNGVSEDIVPPGAVVVADDLPPSRFLAVDWSKGGGIALSAGSPTSHVAMLARARGVPMVVGVAGIDARTGAPEVEALVDGEAGLVVFDPDPATRAAFSHRMRQAEMAAVGAERLRFAPARTAAGELVKVMINIADPAELDGLDPAQCDGIGLVRTELLFEHGASIPDEDAQTEVYSRIARWAAGRPVTIRTLDAGGDKPIPGVTIDGESNPFLGTRGIRLSLVRRDLFRTQLRALARAAAEGDVRIMLPMVAVPAELDEARSLLDEATGELAAAGHRYRRPPLGIMVEVPSVALAAERFAADFYSIGSNDLTQYTLAAARDINAVAHLANARDPAVLRLVRMTVDAARLRGVDVSLCGDAGADPAALHDLLDQGLRSVSVAPIAIARVKQAIGAHGRV